MIDDALSTAEACAGNSSVQYIRPPFRIYDDRG